MALLIIIGCSSYVIRKFANDRAKKNSTKITPILLIISFVYHMQNSLTTTSTTQHIINKKTMKSIFISAN